MNSAALVKEIKLYPRLEEGILARIASKEEVWQKGNSKECVIEYVKFVFAMI